MKLDRMVLSLTLEPDIIIKYSLTLPNQSVEPINLTHLITMINIFSCIYSVPVQVREPSVSAQAHLTCKSRCGIISLINKPLLSWLQSPICSWLGFVVCRQMNPFSLVTSNVSGFSYIRCRQRCVSEMGRCPFVVRHLITSLPKKLESVFYFMCFAINENSRWWSIVFKVFVSWELTVKGSSYQFDFFLMWLYQTLAIV